MSLIAKIIDKKRGCLERRTILLSIKESPHSLLSFRPCFFCWQEWPFSQDIISSIGPDTRTDSRLRTNAVRKSCYICSQRAALTVLPEVGNVWADARNEQAKIYTFGLGNANWKCEWETGKGAVAEGWAPVSFCHYLAILDRFAELRFSWWETQFVKNSFSLFFFHRLKSRLNDFPFLPFLLPLQRL